MSGVHTFESREPKRAFIWILHNRDGSLDKRRMTLDDYRELKAACVRGRGPGPLAGQWAYEQPGEAGIYPTMEEWNAIHAGEGCGKPCSRCEAAGYDGTTGKTKGGSGVPALDAAFKAMRKAEDEDT
jgi:hypothetical protein